MTNDLNRQLCELCGIEKTVDFTKPENFVRLFDLKINNHTNALTIAYVVTNNYAICSTEEFLYYLLCELRAGFAISNVKQSIREAEWVYD